VAAIIPPVDITDPQPKVQRYGLFAAATGPLPLPVHARGGGLRWQDVTTDLPEGFAVTCAAAPVTFEDDCGDWITATPFTVQSTLTTGAIGMPQEEIRRILMDRLRAGEQAVVEQIFSSGTFGQSHSLANNAPNAAVVAATAATVLGGVSALEEWLAARVGVRGVIHAPAVLSGWLNDRAGVVEKGGRWVTQLGNVVSIGNYAGTSPTGVDPAAGHTWLYITGQTTVWSTPDNDVEVSPYVANLDIALPADGEEVMNNTINAFARREYVVSHNQVLAACDVTIA
jgi:hypothetical protein